MSLRRTSVLTVRKTRQRTYSAVLVCNWVHIKIYCELISEAGVLLCCGLTAVSVTCQSSLLTDWLTDRTLVLLWRSCPLSVVLKVSQLAAWPIAKIELKWHADVVSEDRHSKIYTGDAWSPFCAGGCVSLSCGTKSRISVGIAPDSERRWINTV